jgi:CRP/FNR family transcriptional regulator
MQGKNENMGDLIYDLNERKKELNCLYEVKQILRDTNAPLDSIFNQIIKVLPDGWQFPGKCEVKIEFEEKTFKSSDFKESIIKQESPLFTDNAEVGRLSIFYLDTEAKENEFLKEEFKLLDAITDEISQYLTLKRYLLLLKTKKSVSQQPDLPTGLYGWLMEMGLSDSEVNSFVKNDISFKKGETVFKHGSFATYVLLLTKGLMKAVVEDVNDRRFAFKVYTPYDIIGLSSLFGQGSFSYTITSIQNCSGYLIHKDTIMELVESNSRFNKRILNWYNNNIQFLHMRMNMLANKQALGRVASTLVYLSDDIFKNSMIDKTMTRKNIAELSGVSMENTVRILSEFKKDKIINVSGYGIEIVKPEILKTFSIAG